MTKLDKIMSNLRLNHNLKKEQAFTNILYQLLTAHDDKTYKIIGWGKKIQGYGIKQIDFDSFKDSSYRVDERIFRNNKKKLVDKKFIQIFDKSTHTKKGPYYSITALGLFYLLQNIGKITDYEITRLFKLLQSFYTSKSKFDNAVLKHFTEKQKLQAFENLFKYCKFDITDERTIFSIYIPVGMIDVIFLEARISSKEIFLNIAQMVQIGTILPTVIDQKEINIQIAYSVHHILSYYLYKQMKNKKEILKLPKDFQQTINSIGHMLGVTLQTELDEITKERERTFGSAHVLEVQNLIGKF